jgi:hypothetical protein
MNFDNAFNENEDNPDNETNFTGKLKDALTSPTAKIIGAITLAAAAATYVYLTGYDHGHDDGMVDGFDVGMFLGKLSQW